MSPTDMHTDGHDLLTGREVGELLQATVSHAGGVLVNWSLDHVDVEPGRATTATYLTQVDWPDGRRDELLGASVRVGGPTSADAEAEIMTDGRTEVAVWLYPDDPDLPGLATATVPGRLADVFNRHRLLPGVVRAEELDIAMITYRPRRRAVVRVRVGGSCFYVKVVDGDGVGALVARQQLLGSAGLPVPEIVAVTDDHLVITRELLGRPLAEAVFDEQPPCSGEQLVALLDALPAQLVMMPRRRAWSDAIEHYTRLVASGVPGESKRLHWLEAVISQGLAGRPLGNEATHGDFHEGQLHVAGGGIVGLLDIDTAGPGRRVDDLACMVAHLSSVQNMDAVQDQRVRRVLADWVPTFDRRVDPVELRLRSAAVLVSLATGPYRSQEPQWQTTTSRILSRAEGLVRQVV